MRTNEKKVYVKWSPEKLAEALKLLEKHDAKRVGELMEVDANTIRVALWRKGINLTAFRRSITKEKAARRKSAFVKPSDGCRPLAAMETIENDAGGCRWPTGDLDTDNLRFCCHKKARGSFCATHAAIAYIGTGPIPLSVWLDKYDAAQARQKAQDRKKRARRHLARWHINRS